MSVFSIKVRAMQKTQGEVRGLSFAFVALANKRNESHQNENDLPRTCERSEPATPSENTRQATEKIMQAGKTLGRLKNDKKW